MSRQKFFYLIVDVGGSGGGGGGRGAVGGGGGGGGGDNFLIGFPHYFGAMFAPIRDNVRDHFHDDPF